MNIPNFQGPDAVPRLITSIVLVCAIAVSFAISARATNSFVSGNFTIGNWLTVVGTFFVLIGLVVQATYWMAKGAGRGQTNTDLLMRLESLLTDHLKRFDEHIQHDAVVYTEIRDRIEDVNKQIASMGGNE
jgi:hypothetical protein